MISKSLTGKLGSPPRILLFLIPLFLLFLAASCTKIGTDVPKIGLTPAPESQVVIDQITCKGIQFPGDECKLFGDNLGLITRISLVNEGLSPSVSFRFEDTVIVITIPNGIAPSDYIIFFSTVDQEEISTNRLIQTGIITDPTVEPPKVNIRIAGLEWESAQIQTEIIAFILENGYRDISTEIIPGGTRELFAMLIEGQLDLYLEAWDSSLGILFNDAEENGEIIALVTLPPETIAPASRVLH